MKTDLNILKNFTILYCQYKGVSINPLKLQKLLYYIQSWHIVNFEKDTFFSELPEAWVNGPVYKSVYDAFKSTFFKNEDFQINQSENSLNIEIKNTLNSLNITSKQEKLIYAVLDNYGTMSDEKLVFLTHSENPWNNARKGLSPIERSTNLISADDIYNYYTQKLKRKNG